MGPITIDDAKRIVEKEQQESFQINIDQFTEYINDRILDATREGQNYIYLFNFFYYSGQVSFEAKEQEALKILRSLFNGEDKYFKNIDGYRHDAQKLLYDNKAYTSVIKLFLEKGYKIKITQGIGNDIKIDNISRWFFQKPHLILKYYEYPAFAALGCPNSTEEIKKLMTKGNNKFIHVDLGHVTLYWEE